MGLNVGSRSRDRAGCVQSDASFELKCNIDTVSFCASRNGTLARSSTFLLGRRLLSVFSILVVMGGHVFTREVSM